MVHSNQHEPNRFTPVVKAMELVDHVLTITDNINKFPDYTTKEKKNEDGTVTMVLVQRQDGLVNWAREQAMQIYLLAWTANEINLDKEPWRKEERLQKQEAAIINGGNRMKIIPLIGSILDRHKTDNAREIAEGVKSVTDYNIMMGNLEDPAEGDEMEEMENE